MQIEISSDERYPYIFLRTEEDELQSYLGATPEYLSGVVRDWRKRAYDVPDELIQTILDARKTEDEALERLRVYMEAHYPDSIRWD